jgi:NAD(P)-dependent dehydrogenase (short-subunit alcohol dehydrogenase family)
MAFTGKVALVTGAGSGMGQRACERLAARGATVAALDINAAGLEKTAAVSEQIHTFTVDVTDTGAVADIVAKVDADLGSIDRVMAAAGIMPSARLVDMDTATVLKTMRVNFDGVVNVVKPTLELMLERGRGDMVIFASLVGHQPVMGQAAYSASKFAVRAFAEVLYNEHINSPLRFACVCPPAVDTPLINQLSDEGRFLIDQLPDKIAKITPDKVLDAIEKNLEKGKFWVMPGIAKGAAAYYRMSPSLYWKGFQKLDKKRVAG